jgi:hypothetical protein
MRRASNGLGTQRSLIGSAVSSMTREPESLEKPIKSSIRIGRLPVIAES